MTLDDIFKGMSTIGHVFEFVFSEVRCCKFKKFFKCLWCFTTPTTVSFRFQFRFMFITIRVKILLRDLPLPPKLEEDDFPEQRSQIVVRDPKDVKCFQVFLL